MDTREPLTANGDTALMLRRIDDKEATSISAASVYTARQAYKALMSAPALSDYADQLAKLNLNDFLVPNLIYDHERSQASLSELKRSVPKASGIVQRGQKIVNQGEVVNQEKFLIIDSYRKELEKRYDQSTGISTTLAT